MVGKARKVELLNISISPQSCALSVNPIAIRFQVEEARRHKTHPIPTNGSPFDLFPFRSIRV